MEGDETSGLSGLGWKLAGAVARIGQEWGQRGGSTGVGEGGKER